MGNKPGSNGNGAKRGKGRRPREFDAKVGALIVEQLESGVYEAIALKAVKVGPTLLARWRREQPEFAERMDMAEARFEARHTAVVNDAAVEDWRASAWLLEHKTPERWSTRRIDARNQGSNTGINIIIHMNDDAPVGREQNAAAAMGMSHPLPIPDLEQQLPAPAPMPTDEELRLAAGGRPRPQRR